MTLALAIDLWCATGLAFVCWRLRWPSLRREVLEAFQRVGGFFLAIALGPISAIVYWLDGKRFRRNRRRRRDSKLLGEGSVAPETRVGLRADSPE